MEPERLRLQPLGMALESKPQGLKPKYLRAFSARLEVAVLPNFTTRPECWLPAPNERARHDRPALRKIGIPQRQFPFSNGYRYLRAILTCSFLARLQDSSYNHNYSVGH